MEKFPEELLKRIQTLQTDVKRKRKPKKKMDYIFQIELIFTNF